MNYNRIAILTSSCALSVFSASAQIEFGVDFTTEGQYNFSEQRFAWVNLLDLSASTSLWQGASLSVEALSTYLNKSTVSHCALGYSNVNVENRAFRLFDLSLTQQWGALRVSAGLKNMNGDYFATPFTTFFTAPSHGIFPTVDFNFSAPNYPLAAWGIQLDYALTDHLTLKTCLYDAAASDRLADQFSFRWGKDGFFNANELCWLNDADCEEAGSYHLGAAFSNRPGNQSVWAAVEQPLWRGADDRLVGLLLDGGWDNHARSECTTFAGIGLYGEHLLLSGDRCGAVWITSEIDHRQESCLELSYSLPLVSHLTLQPALHITAFGSDQETIGLLRLNYAY